MQNPCTLLSGSHRCLLSEAENHPQTRLECLENLSERPNERGEPLHALVFELEDLGRERAGSLGPSQATLASLSLCDHL